MSTETPLESDLEASFAETALKLGGKSDDEARRTGAIDKADDQVEALFAPQYQTVHSPAHRAVWERGVPTDLFEGSDPTAPKDVQQVMDASVEVVKNHLAHGTLQDEAGKITTQVFSDLAACGYWGLLVGREYGGSGAPFAAFGPFLTRMAMIDPTIAGLASVHGCIGAVDPVSTFGNAEQKQRFLPDLASGKRLSAFALTEPCAGSDLTQLRTRAVLDGDSYVVSGEKLFITNVTAGRTIGLVCLIDDKPAVLIVDLPQEENSNFSLKKYGLWALKHTYNQGIVFNGLRVPAENLLAPKRGDGLTIAYHGLNLGRIALCANAAGTMRVMMASMIPWANFRVTYSAPIAKRELVQRRLGQLAGLITACDALTSWCSGLIDRGYRGEMECVIAKVFGSEVQKHAAIELCMKTHGGRAFLHGHLLGDNVHEFLAPCIYEGEGEMLGMAFFKSMVKHHGKTYFEPIGKALAAAGIKKPNPLNPAHAWALKGVVTPYLKWLAAQKLLPTAKSTLPQMPAELARHVEFACENLQKMALEISNTMGKFQLSLADRQCRMAELSGRCQNLITILCTSLYGARQTDEIVRASADILCQELTQKHTGARPSNRYFRQITELGGAIANGSFNSIAGIDADQILMRYDA
ncbi:MAG: acyl-CoA dehydrogenase family protein [Planctomycetales bacterium]|nr:acyl-CoA dehydrogenase family protein [Planctomycetales bacterium]